MSKQSRDLRATQSVMDNKVLREGTLRGAHGVMKMDSLKVTFTFQFGRETQFAGA